MKLKDKLMMPFRFDPIHQKAKEIIANILIAIPAVLALAFRVYWTFMGR